VKLWFPTTASSHAQDPGLASDIGECLMNLALVSFSSVLALLSNLGRCFLVAATSPLTETLAGNAKVATLCIIDHYLFHTVLSWKNYAGIGLTFSGFSVHLLLQYAIKEDKEDMRQGPETPSAKTSKVVNRPRLISAADTGLAAEHLAVEVGREPAQFRRIGGENGLAPIPELPRPRSVTWPQPAPKETSGMFGASVDFSLVFQVPVWLEANKPGSPEDYSPLSVASLSPMARRSPGAVWPPAGNMSPTSAARLRCYSDPTDTNNNRARLLEDVRLGPQNPKDDSEEEAGITELAEPPDLGFL